MIKLWIKNYKLPRLANFIFVAKVGKFVAKVVRFVWCTTWQKSVNVSYWNGSHTIHLTGLMSTIQHCVPLETHKFLIEGISEGSHIKKKILERYLTFVKSPVKSKKPIVKSLFHITSKDICSVPASILRHIYDQTGIFINLGVTLKYTLQDCI